MDQAARSVPGHDQPYRQIYKIKGVRYMVERLDQGVQGS